MLIFSDVEIFVVGIIRSGGAFFPVYSIYVILYDVLVPINVNLDSFSLVSQAAGICSSMHDEVLRRLNMKSRRS